SARPSGPTRPKLPSAHATHPRAVCLISGSPACGAEDNPVLLGRGDSPRMEGFHPSGGPETAVYGWSGSRRIVPYLRVVGGDQQHNGDETGPAHGSTSFRF